MSKLEDLKRLAAARTKGEWHSALGSGNCELTAIFAGDRFICDLVPEWALDYDLKDKNANQDFIEYIANNIDALLAVVEAAKKHLEDEAYGRYEDLAAALTALEGDG